ncbi:MAG: folylpolyglutamate synthase/dihydrofolate synthase family protein [Oscillospiraceae bacterium]|nr:folylpolyglutamate synthase/dihydrofolate synthase family protein [Oscillospiraceae bacterium]
MTEKEAIAYIENYTWSATRLGLERTRELLSRLGDPQKSLKFVHVAGSNGKGSTCAMLASVLKKAGYRIGLYVSPHITSFCERIQVNGEHISGEELAAATERVKAAADLMSDHPSQFELSTAIALTYFKEKLCDIVVLEVGMGGALDSTNAIDAPEVAVITNIGLEHTEYLGDTLAEIASAKAGIIKPGCGAVCYELKGEALEVIRAVCKEKGVELSLADSSEIEPLGRDMMGQDFRWRGLNLFLPLLGAHQLKNTAVALAAVEALRKRGWEISDAALRTGLALVSWPARFEVLSTEPLFILDGAHNPQCVEALVANIKSLLPNQKLVFILGVLEDKDYGAMIDMVSPLAERFLCLTPKSPRALSAERLAEYINERGIKADAFESAGEALRACLESKLPAAAFGSLYMAGEISQAFRLLRP